jgi:hypothetical protein
MKFTIRRKIGRVRLSIDRQKILPDLWRTPKAHFLGTGISLSNRHFGGDHKCKYGAASLIGGDRGESAEGKPLGPVFGLLYPIGKVPAGHDGGCELVKVGCWFLEGGKQQSLKTLSPYEWLGIRLSGG